MGLVLSSFSPWLTANNVATVLMDDFSVDSNDPIVINTFNR